MLAHGQIRVNGEIAKIASSELSAGDQVEVVNRVESSTPGHGLKIAYEDRDLLLAEKPTGLLTVATPHERERTAFSYLRTYVKERDPGQQLFVVHRLDKFASGVLVFAKSEIVRSRLRTLFRRHDITRRYWAVVEGRFPQEKGTIRSHLSENRALRMHSTEDTVAGKEAITHFRVLRRFPQLTILEITLETGRKNQIRVHLSEMGHPIVGDRAYGSTLDPMKRLGLHAFMLGFRHPILGTYIEHRTEVPVEFARYIKFS